MPARPRDLAAQFFAYVQMRKLRVVRQGDLVRSVLGFTAEQERKLLSRLARAKRIARVRRGLYLVPARPPISGTWTPAEVLAINTLIADRKGRYQICGPNAFSRYGYSEQLPNRLYAYNNRISGNRKVGAISITLIKVADRRLGDTAEDKSDDGEVAVYASRARTLFDAVYDWSRFGALPRAYEWIRADLAARNVSASELIRVTLRYGDIGTIRRIGAVLEREGVDLHQLKPLSSKLRSAINPLPMVPRRPRRGEVDPRWGVIWNDGD